MIKFFIMLFSVGSLLGVFCDFGSIFFIYSILCFEVLVWAMQEYLLVLLSADAFSVLVLISRLYTFAPRVFVLKNRRVKCYVLLINILVKMVNTTSQSLSLQRRPNIGTQQVTLFQFQRPRTGWDPYSRIFLFCFGIRFWHFANLTNVHINIQAVDPPSWL